MSAEDREAWQALSTKCRTKLDALADKEDLPPATLVKIAELATDRGYGKAVQSVELSGGDNGPIGFKFVDPPSTPQV
jgi:hypothetical protein